MKKFLHLLVIAILTTSTLQAQDFKFGQYSLEEMNMTKYAKDTSAHAVYLKEFGKAWISSGDRIPLVFEYHAKIKILDNEGFDQGTIIIPLSQVDNDHFEEVRDIQAVTYYTDEKGLVQKSVLDEKNIFHTKEDKHWDMVKFTLPNLRKGCIIEYKYHLESPHRWSFRTWHFQDDIPKIYSEFEAHLPAVYNYNVSLRGPYKLTDMKSELEHECFSPGNGIKCDCSKMSYIMKDVPAFVREEYMTAPKNFMSAIYFELSDYVDLNTGAKIKVTKDWKDVDYELKHDESFGGQIRRSGLMKDRMQSIIAGKTDDLSKAQTIYQYMQKNFKWNGYINWWSDDGIRKAMDNHSGSVGDINLTLIAALSASGINTDAVLLSTRDHGVVNKLYPVESDFNYVVAKVNIGDKSYLLDATDPMLPFGLLPFKCINDQGRVINMNKPSYWIDLTASEKRINTYAFDLTLQDDGKMKGTMVSYSSGYEALNARKAIKKFNSTDEYVDKLDNDLKKIKILKSTIENLDSLDKPLVEKYDIEIDAYKGLKDKLLFNPFLAGRTEENPFKLQERNYPVDMGSASDYKFILTLHLPQGYAVESVPQNQALSLPLQGGKFIMSYDKHDDGVSISRLTQFTRSIYSTQEYPYLKEIYNKIIQSQVADIVIKKKDSE